VPSGRDPTSSARIAQTPRYPSVKGKDIFARLIRTTEPEHLRQKLVQNVARGQARPIETLEGISVLRYPGYSNAETAWRVTDSGTTALPGGAFRRTRLGAPYKLRFQSKSLGLDGEGQEMQLAECRKWASRAASNIMSVTAAPDFVPKTMAMWLPSASAS
jgi:hypothetical protein